VYNAFKNTRYTLHYTHQHWICPEGCGSQWKVNCLKTYNYEFQVDLYGTQKTLIVVIDHRAHYALPEVKENTRWLQRAPIFATGGIQGAGDLPETVGFDRFQQGRKQIAMPVCGVLQVRQPIVRGKSIAQAIP